MRPAIFRTKGTDVVEISASPDAIYIAKKEDGTVWLGSSFENSLLIELDMTFDEAYKEHIEAMTFSDTNPVHCIYDEEKGIVKMHL